MVIKEYICQTGAAGKDAYDNSVGIPVAEAQIYYALGEK